METTVKVMPTAELMKPVVDYIKQGHKVVLPLRGRSMRPFLEHERDRALLCPPGLVSIGDIVLAEVRPDFFVLHRVVKIDIDQLTLLGDGNLKPEKCHISSVRAIAKGFYRKGRDVLDRPDQLKWRIYAAYWMHQPLLLRRCLLFLYRLFHD